LAYVTTSAASAQSVGGSSITHLPPSDPFAAYPTETAASFLAVRHDLRTIAESFVLDGLKKPAFSRFKTTDQTRFTRVAIHQTLIRVDCHRVVVVVDVDVDVDDPRLSGSLAEANAATEPEMNPGSEVVALPAALSVATSVVPVALAAKAAVELAA